MKKLIVAALFPALLALAPVLPTGGAASAADTQAAPQAQEELPDHAILDEKGNIITGPEDQNADD